MNEDVQLTNTVEQTRLFQWFMKFSCVARAATLWPPAYRSRTRVVTFESRGPSGEKLGTGFERIESCWVASRPYTHTCTRTYASARLASTFSISVVRIRSYDKPLYPSRISKSKSLLGKKRGKLEIFQVKNSSDWAILFYLKNSMNS